MAIFKDRNLSIAIFVSVLWHSVFMLSFKPVFLTGRMVEHNTSIAFLGDILKNAGSYTSKGPSELRQYRDGMKFEKFSLSENKMAKIEPAESDFISIKSEKKEFLDSLDGGSSLELGMYHKKETARVNFYDFFIKGDAKDRAVMYKPDLNKITVLPSDFNSGFSANIKFKISKEGFVQYVECVTSSGFFEIDQAAMRYMRKWQFVPVKEEGQEGLIRVSFE